MAGKRRGKESAKQSARASVKRRKIAIDRATADLLQARADALGISVAELMTAIVDNRPAAAPIAANGNPQAAASGASSAEVAPSGARWREVKAWIDSWGKANELPRPKLGK